MLLKGRQEPENQGSGMPFLVLNRHGEPMTDPETALICQFDTRDEAEAYRKAHKGDRVMEIPSSL